MFIVYGSSHLARRIGQKLENQGHAVTFIQETSELETNLRKLDLREVLGFLAVSEKDSENLSAVYLVKRLAPDLPCTLSTLDPCLGELLESRMKIRAALSISSLTATALASATVEQEVLASATVGEFMAPVSRLKVQRGSRWIGLTPNQAEAHFNCALLARRKRSNSEFTLPDSTPIQLGDEIILAGLLEDVLAAGNENSRKLKKGKLPTRPRKGERCAPRKQFKRTKTALSLVSILAAAYVVLVGAFTSYFHFALKLTWLDSLYFVISMIATAGANIPVITKSAAVKIATIIMLISGTALLTIVISVVASMLAEKRISIRMGQEGKTKIRHVILCGLGKVGYRTALHLLRLGVELTIIDLSPEGEFAATLRENATVLTGDARFPENLERASVGTASAFIACTGDAFTNFQACMHAKRLNPEIRTVLRSADPELAQALSGIFELDSVISPDEIASVVFAASALSEFKLQEIHAPPLRLVVCHSETSIPVSGELLRDWRSQGIRIAAFQNKDGSEHPGTQFRGEMRPQELVLCGPAEAFIKSEQKQIFRKGA